MACFVLIFGETQRIMFEIACFLFCWHNKGIVALTDNVVLTICIWMNRRLCSQNILELALFTL